MKAHSYSNRHSLEVDVITEFRMGCLGKMRLMVGLAQRSVCWIKSKLLGGLVECYLHS
jgi:hypothetical protein